MGIKSTAIASLLLALGMSACGPTQKTDASDTASAPGTTHADNDIAMTVRSISDAIRVGEPLRAADYDFTGVFTDGQGTPIYTDLSGAPGKWRVKVTSPETAVITNLNPGDILPADLRLYLLQNLGQDAADTTEDLPGDAVEDVEVYKIKGVSLRFETTMALTAEGDSSPLVQITISPA